MRRLMRMAGVLVAALSLGGVAHAKLLERDLFNHNDNALTFDTSTRLEWLDLTRTLGLSYNQALASVYVADLGFRFATPDEVLHLWGEANIAPGTSQANYPGVVALEGFLGCTTQCSNAAASQGWMDLGSPTSTAYSFIQLHFTALVPGGPLVGFGEGDMNDVPFASRNTALFDTGNYLVRAVPEPATWALLLGGFFLAGAQVRGRRRMAIVAAARGRETRGRSV